MTDQLMDHLWVPRALTCLCVAVNLNLSQNGPPQPVQIQCIISSLKCFFLCKQFDCQGERMYVFIHSDVVPKQLQSDLIPLLREVLCTKVQATFRDTLAHQHCPLIQGRGLKEKCHFANSDYQVGVTSELCISFQIQFAMLWCWINNNCEA